MICIVDCGSSWVENIESVIKKLGHDVTVIKMNELKNANLERFSGIVISGRPTLLTQENIPEIKDHFSFIKNSKLPILGICFGHQIIGLIFGSAIDVGKPIDKMESIEFVTGNILLNSINNNSLFRESHSEFISLPQDFVLLAKSASCNNEAMKHKNKPIYSTQFHPEVSGTDGQKVFHNFLKIL